MIIEDALYTEIIRMMPVPCVDLCVIHNNEKVLLVKRKNAPAKGLLWFPGGRVHYKESRIDAAKRKLHEECFLSASHITEIGTFDLIFEESDEVCALHGITTLFRMDVHDEVVSVDNQSESFVWTSIEACHKELAHDFLRIGLNKALFYRGM